MKNYQFSWRLFIIIVVIIAVVVFTVYSESQQTIACLACPVSYTGEKIGLNSLQVNSPTSIIIGITNTGSLNLGLASYYLKDTKGDMYWNQTGSVPFLGPGGVATVNLSLTGTLTGQPFQFQSRQTYTVELVTTRNNPFTYAFTA